LLLLIKSIKKIDFLMHKLSLLIVNINMKFNLMSQDNKITIIIDRYNVAMCNNDYFFIFSDFKYEIEEGLRILFNDNEYCVIKKFRNADEFLPKIHLDSIKISEEIRIITCTGFLNVLPANSTFKIIGNNSDQFFNNNDNCNDNNSNDNNCNDNNNNNEVDNFVHITLCKGTNIQNCVTYEQVVLDEDTMVIVL